MKIAVVGKGGSGKSTVSSLLSLALAKAGKNVLAIDADYNMDMAYGLGLMPEKSSLLHDDKNNFYEYIGLSEDVSGKTIFEHIQYVKPRFSIFPHDTFIEKYIHTHDSKNLHIVVSGGYTKQMLFGSSCSHGYYKPLKYYLGFVEKSPNDYIIIDSVAGTDMVGYGLYLGVDALIVVVEPSVQSRNVYKQIASLATMLSIPTYYILNKTCDAHDDLVTDVGCLGRIAGDMGLMNYGYDGISEENKKHVQTILANLNQIPIVSSSDYITRYNHYHTMI